MSLRLICMIFAAFQITTGFQSLCLWWVTQLHIHILIYILILLKWRHGCPANKGSLLCPNKSHIFALNKHKKQPLVVWRMKSNVPEWQGQSDKELLWNVSDWLVPCTVSVWVWKKQMKSCLWQSQAEGVTSLSLGFMCIALLTTYNSLIFDFWPFCCF